LHYLAFPLPEVVNPDDTYHVTGMSEGVDHTLWIATYAGVFGYADGEFTVINDEALGFSKATGGLHVRSVLGDSRGRLWIGNNGIGVLLRENGTIINFSEANGLIGQARSRSGDKSEAGTLEHVFAIEEDAEGNIWFADRDTGIWQYNGKAMKHFEAAPGPPNAFAHTIYKDKHNELWFVLTDGSVFTFNGATFDQRFK
jgi:ligand-binding sensor domain-containing protein